MTGKKTGTSSRLRKSFKYTAEDVGGMGRAIAVGKDCTYRTYSCVFDDSKGFKMFADTRYFIEVAGKEVYVNAPTLKELIGRYQSGGIDAAVAFLEQQDSIDS
jgi:hypothetical protein